MKAKTDYIFKILLFTALYVTIAKAGLLFAFNDGLATAIWAPSGLALIMLFHYGKRMWPVIFIGAFTINLLQGGSLSAAAQIGVGNTLEGVIILLLLKNKENSFVNFTQLRSTIIFIFAVFAGAALSALIGSMATAIFLQSSSVFTETIVTWWLGDVISCLIIVPGVFLFSKNSLKELQSKNVLLFFSFLILTCYFIFFKDYSHLMTLAKASVYTLIIFSLWASVRFSGFVASLTVLTIFSFVVTSTLLGEGPFVHAGQIKNDLVMIQVLITILAVTTLIVSAGIKEKALIEEKLKDSLREKELLLSEIHHRVKNNLAVISGLLFLQEEKIANIDTRKSFSEIQGRIKSMALVHEKLYKNASFAKIEFGSYVKELTTSIEASYSSSTQPIYLNIDIEEHLLDINRAIPCGLILNEILTNAYKYAFIGRSEGNIEINFSKNTKGYSLLVSDNGVGFDILKRKDDDSLGLTLVTSLSKQLGATMTVKQNKGTIFEFNFN